MDEMLTATTAVVSCTKCQEHTNTHRGFLSAVCVKAVWCLMSVCVCEREGIQRPKDRMNINSRNLMPHLGCIKCVCVCVCVCLIFLCNVFSINRNLTHRG